MRASGGGRERVWTGWRERESERERERERVYGMKS